MSYLNDRWSDRLNECATELVVKNARTKFCGFVTRRKPGKPNICVGERFLTRCFITKALTGGPHVPDRGTDIKLIAQELIEAALSGKIKLSTRQPPWVFPASKVCSNNDSTIVRELT